MKTNIHALGEGSYLFSFLKLYAAKYVEKLVQNLFRCIHVFWLDCNNLSLFVFIYLEKTKIY